MIVYIITNYWELFIATLLMLKISKENKNYMFIVNIYNFKKNPKMLSNISKYTNVIFFDFKHNQISKFFLYLYRINIEIPKKINEKQIETVVSFSDQDVITRFFIKKNKNIILYEHGVVNYQEHFYGLTQFIKKIFFKMEQPYGRNKNVKEIYLKFPSNSPKDIAHKVKKLDLSYLIGKLTKYDINLIYKIFEISLTIEENSFLLLTQPMEVQGCPISEKINIYSNILEEYKGEKIYIKPHPLENKNFYSLLSDKGTILESNFPIEILLLNGTKFKKVITMYSSAATSFIGICDVIFFGTEKYQNLFKNFSYPSKNFFISQINE